MLDWFALAGAGGFVGGLVLSGVVTEVSWWLAFALPLPIALVVLIAAPRLLPRDGPQGGGALDVQGGILVTGAFVALVAGLTQAPAWARATCGWWACSSVRPCSSSASRTTRRGRPTPCCPSRSCAAGRPARGDRRVVLLALSYGLFLRLEPGSGFVAVVLPVMLVDGLGLAWSSRPSPSLR